MLWSTSRHNISIFSVLPLIVVISKFPRQIREKRNWRLNYLHQCWHSEGWVWLVLCLWHRRHPSWVQVQVPGTWWVVFLNVMNPCVIVSLVSELPNLSCGENIYCGFDSFVNITRVNTGGSITNMMHVFRSYSAACRIPTFLGQSQKVGLLKSSRLPVRCANWECCK